MDVATPPAPVRPTDPADATPPDAVRVLLVDDHRLFRQGLAGLLRDHPTLRVIGEAGTRAEAVAEARRLRPDVILMDVHLPDGTGIEALRAILAEQPEVRVVMLSMSDADADVLAALRAGAMGYVSKGTDLAALLVALDAVSHGQAALSPHLIARVLGHLRAPGAPPAPPHAGDRLSAREREVLTHLARGAPNKQIARALSLSEHTVRSHITSILAKLHLENRVQAAAFALRHAPE